MEAITVSFCAAATGFPAPTYQWRFNGGNIPGATGACFNLPSASITNIGTYDVVAANAVGTHLSPAVTLAFADLKMLAAVYLMYHSDIGYLLGMTRRRKKTGGES